MRLTAITLALFLAAPALADPTQEALALDAIFKGRILKCIVAHENIVRTYFSCEGTEYVKEKCFVALTESPDQRLSQCVARGVTQEERKLWEVSPLNPVRKAKP